MRRLLGLVALLGVALVGVSRLEAQCGFSVPMFHGLDSYFVCPDGRPVYAFAYQLGDPTATNSGTAKIACEALDGVACFSGGTAGDGQVTIQTDWANPGIIGCPVLPDGGSQRVVIVVAGSGDGFGRGLVVSLSGSSPALGYVVEAAHRFVAATMTALPLDCENVVSSAVTVSGQTFARFVKPAVFTDCDPDSIGFNLASLAEGAASTCTDDFHPTVALGPVYTLVQPCADPVDIHKDLWTDTGVTPVPGGDTILPAGPLPAGACRYIGSTTVVNGLETAVITGFANAPLAGGCENPNFDGDSIPESIDNCPCVYNPDQQNVDGDRFGDVCDSCPQVPNDDQRDSDGDGVGDACDNCPSVYNPDQRNTDGDLRGDACDNCVLAPNQDQNDADADTYGDACDNCPTVVNPDQRDIDLDLVGDVCDSCPSVYNPGQTNSDADPYGDACDNCPGASNPDQSDIDFDRVGNLCDICPTIYNPDQNGCACDVGNCGYPLEITVDFSSTQGKGSGTVSWGTTGESNIVGFNVVVFDGKGNRLQQNTSLIPCKQCTTGLGDRYAFIIPKHKSGRNIFVEMVRQDGFVNTFGPAVKR